MLFFSFLLLFGSENQLPPSLELAIENRMIDHKILPVLDATELKKDLKLVVNTDLNATSYSATKADIGQLRKNLNEKLRQGNISFDTIKTEFTNHLVNKIIPHWYGTPWSFEGHTAVPNQGKIACGYFISTTLRDMGIKLNRYKLAQKSPIDEAKIISCGSEIKSVEQESGEKAFEEIDQLTREGLYFIGFDKGHVGYLLKRNGQLFVIHSNYFSPGSVCIEPFQESRVFKSYSKFHIVDISNNEVLMQRWLNNEILL